MERLNEKGQSLFELILAVGITAVTLVAVISLVGSSISNSTFSRDRTVASRYTNEAMEWIRAKRDEGWTEFINQASASGTTYCLNNLSANWPSAGSCSNTILGTNFSREAEIIYDAGIDARLVEVHVITSWNDSSGYHESRASTTLSNWRTE